jgi:hypothetical protein
MEFGATQFSVASDGTLVAEASELRLRQPPAFLRVDGSQFRMVGDDVSGGDIMGWRYVEEGVSGRRLLIIND